MESHKHRNLTVFTCWDYIKQDVCKLSNEVGPYMDYYMICLQFSFTVFLLKWAMSKNTLQSYLNACYYYFP